jgi:hypothetical protein
METVAAEKTIIGVGGTKPVRALYRYQRRCGGPRRALAGGRHQRALYMRAGRTHAVYIIDTILREAL